MPRKKSDKPILFDLYAGCGGGAMGYHRAGWRVIGFDIEAQPHYPFEFYRMDALAEWPKGLTPQAIHASPPCKMWTAMNNGQFGPIRDYPDFIGPTRDRLLDTKLPYIIENVPGAPLIDPVMLCGSMFNLRIPAGYLQRHRLFESNVPLRAPGPCRHEGQAIGVYGHGRGGGPMKMRTANAQEAKLLMGIDWAGRQHVSQSIPPAYTEYLGGQLMIEAGLA